MSEEAHEEAVKLPAVEFPIHFCPVCSSKLQSRHCKMVCPRCAYFMSCSEFD